MEWIEIDEKAFPPFEEDQIGDELLRTRVKTL